MIAAALFVGTAFASAPEASAHGSGWPYHQSSAPYCWTDSYWGNRISSTVPSVYPAKTGGFTFDPNTGRTISGSLGWEYVYWRPVVTWYDQWGNVQTRYGGWMRKLSPDGLMWGWEAQQRDGSWAGTNRWGASTSGVDLGGARGTYYVWSEIWWEAYGWPEGRHTEYTGSCTF